MKVKYLLLFLVVLIQFSCEYELEPVAKNETLIHAIADFLIAKGYVVEITDDNHLTVHGGIDQIDQIQFLSYVNEFHRSIGLEEPYDLKNLDKSRSNITCHVSDTYTSGAALCWNTVCFDANENLVNFYTTCESCLTCQ